MSEAARCDQIRELAPEAALGVLSGEDRALVLEHIATCSGCREHLDELARTMDEILRLAPAAEPPAGFETRVLSALDRARRPRTHGLIRLVAACIAGGLVIGAGAFYWSASDRRLADHYRETLAVADGRYFDAAPLTSSSGDAVGHVFAYEGTPSWVVVVLDDAGGAHEVTLTSGGHVYSIGTMVAEGSGSAWGTAIPVAVHDMEAVIVRPSSPDASYRAEF